MIFESFLCIKQCEGDLWNSTWKLQILGRCQAFRKQLQKPTKHRANDSESDSNSDYSSCSHGSDSTGELNICKKRTLNVTVNDYTYPSPSKAIQTNKIEFNINFNSILMQENISKKSYNKKMSRIIMICPMTLPMLLVIISL